jgi:hypothetical protein
MVVLMVQRLVPLSYFGAATTAADGSTYAAGWFIDIEQTLIEHGVKGQWSIDPTPDPGTGDNGFAGITAVPGGGLWAVGVMANKREPRDLDRLSLINERDSAYA